MGNFSRDTFDRLKHYVGVRLQQGVPIVDADWNELEDIRKYELQAFLKWFVGNGIPAGNDGFRIIAVTDSNDFGIQGGDGTAAGAGHCLVDGWDVINESTVRFTAQPLFNNTPLATAWGVAPITPLTTPAANRNDLVYLDVWEREVDSTGDTTLVNPAIGVETAVRLKREWAVRVVEGSTTLPTSPAGHAYYALATLARTGGSATIAAGAITDRRQTGLNLASLETAVAKLGDHATSVHNPHNVTATQVGVPVSVDGVHNPGGNIDFVAANAITIAPDDRGNRITFGESHSTRTDNPHSTTAAQVGALALSGGTVTGAVNIRDDRLDVRHSVDGGTGAFVWIGHPNARWGVLARATSTLTSAPGAALAAVAGVADLDGVHGVYARANSTTHALHVEGTARFTGAKTGYVVDVFHNASGQRLHTGDLVKLKDSPIRRFQGEHNKIPVAEVTLVDTENDTMVIGIVDREAIPEPNTPDTRVNPEDSTFIEQGGEVFVVTLGAYASCKVDATEAPIEVGDLLTASSRPGHARKATNPRLGSIIGKALEALASGTGQIAVFVNIQ